MLTPSLRIDTAINPTSYLRVLLYTSLMGLLIVLAVFADLLLWQYVLLLGISATVVIWLILSQPIILHLSQPPLSRRVDQGWQLLMRTSHSDDLWQAQLNTVERYHSLIHFKFTVVEPYKRPLSITIFRDQVSAKAWHHLKVLAQLS